MRELGGGGALPGGRCSRADACRVGLPQRRARGYGAAVPPTRFITDDSLELLARRLRMLGYDVITRRGARLEELFEAALVEGRTVLTLSARRPSRFADVPAITAGRGDAAAALRAIALEHEPSGPPFGRCPICGRALQRRLAVEAQGELPGRVLRGAPFLHYCPACAKWYWEGSHTARLRAWLEAALGRPLERPEGPG